MATRAKKKSEVDEFGLDMSIPKVEKVPPPKIDPLMELPEVHHMVRVMPLDGSDPGAWQTLDGEITVYLRNGFRIHSMSTCMRVYEIDGRPPVPAAHLLYVLVKG